MQNCLFGLIIIMLVGCSTTQEDYDLQEKYTQRKRDIQEAERSDAVRFRW